MVPCLVQVAYRNQKRIMIHKDRIIVFARQNRICHHELIQYHKTYVAIRYVNIGLLLKGTYRILPRSLLLVKQKEQRASYFVFTGHRSIKSLITHRVVIFFTPIRMGRIGWDGPKKWWDLPIGLKGSTDHGWSSHDSKVLRKWGHHSRLKLESSSWVVFFRKAKSSRISTSTQLFGDLKVSNGCRVNCRMPRVAI